VNAHEEQLLLDALDAELVEFNPYLADDQIQRVHGNPTLEVAGDTLIGEETPS